MTKNMTEIEVQQKRIKKLIKLTQQNPELEIVPMVDGELGGYEYSYYMGNWGDAEIDEVYHEEERIYFKSSDEEELVNDAADNIINSRGITDLESEVVTNKAINYVNNLPWKKVVVVQINLPY